MTTTLSAGDVAVIGYASATYNATSVPLGKSLAVVLLKAVDVGTVLSFTDDGWFAGGGFRSGEGVLTYTAPTGGAAAGTVITFTNISTASFNFSTSGDQVTVFQGSDTPIATAHATSAVPLFALNYATSGSAFAPEATTSNNTALPAGLTLNSTAVAFNGVNGAYTGTTTGSAAELLAAIDSSANWTFTTSATGPAAYKTSFTVGAASNATPVFTSGATATAVENTATTAAVYTAVATDADDTLSYSLSGTDAGKFSIDATTGVVTFKATPDFETPGSTAGTNVYSFNAVASDGAGGHTVNRAVTLTVTDANDNAPVITSGGAVSVAAGTAAGATVYTAAASDVDTVNGARSYSLGGTDAAKFAINATTGAVSFVASPSYATPDDAGANHIYDITVQASDGVNTSAAKAVAITVVDNNTHAPVFTSAATASTPENVATTAAVYTAAATDADNDTLAYSLSGADAGKFSINAATGVVTFNASPDYEAAGSAAHTNAYSFTVKASDGLAAHDVSQAVTVTVTDANDNSPLITSAATANAPAGVATTTPVYTVTATDADTGPALTYSISGGADVAKFDINAATGVVTFKASPSYSTPDDAGADHVYDIVVTASDGVAAHDATKAVAITVTNPNAGVLFTEGFDTFAATGLTPGGGGGALDSNAWRTSGFSDGASAYGDTKGSGTDYGRGALGGTSGGVFYGVTANSGAGDRALVVQPTGSDFDPSGYLELKVHNGTANVVASLALDFDWVVRNSGDRGDPLAVSYSTDGTTFITLPAGSITTPAAKDASPTYAYTHESLSLGGSVLAPGADVYLRFAHNGASIGSGSRDGVGLDNLKVGYADISHTPVIAVANVSQAEGDSGTTAFIFNVTRAGDVSGASTVHYATADGTAMAGSDYTAVAGDLSFAAGETSKTVVVQVNGDVVQEPNESFTFNLSAQTNATLQNTVATGVITNDDVSVTAIADVQGAAQISPFAGQTVTTQGVVTAIKTGAGGGFYIQDSGTGGAVGGSHGLFVFTAATPNVLVGDAVTVQGLVTEYVGGDNSLPVTELNNPVVSIGTHGNAVTPILVGEGGIHPPTESIYAPGSGYNPALNGLDFWESLEGQLVTIHNAQAVDATYSGSTWVVADYGAGATGINARGGITITSTDFNPERIQVYTTGLNAVIGEHLGDVTGVITYYNGEYELIPTQPITPPVGTATVPPVVADVADTTLKGDANHLSYGTYNVENLDPGDAQARFDALGYDIAHSIGGPDILTLEEIQDADGAGTGGDFSGAATLNKLIAAIAAAGGPNYLYVDIAPTADTGGEPGGHIQVAFLYNPDRVGYVAGSAQLIHDQTPGQGTRTGGNAFYNSREPLLANFTFNGQTITAVGIHNYSRSGSQELFGANQPATNSGDDVRLDQSTEVSNFLATYQAAHPSNKLVVAGDFNAFYFEPSLRIFETGQLGLTNLVGYQPANERYSTGFEGLAQQIDNIIVDQSLAAAAQIETLHVNTGRAAADQASDHDPVVSLLYIPAPNTAPVVAPNQTITAPENQTNVGTIAASDADAGDMVATIAFATGGTNDNALFNLTSAGVLSFKTAPEYEAAHGPYTVSVQATDSHGLTGAAQTVTVTVTDVNDNAPVFTSAATVSVAENTTAVVTVQVTDADTAGGPTTLAFAGGADDGKFDLNATTGALTFKVAPDYETDAHSYAVKVQASDGLHATVQALTVAVTNVNDTPPVITSGGAVSVPETVDTFSAVYTAHGTTVEAATLTYGFGGGADDARFDIDATTGAVTFKAQPDYDAPTDVGANNVYDIKVKASDGVPAHDVTKAVAITVTDVTSPNVAPVFTSAAAVSTAEEATPATVVYTAQATDADGDTLTYSIAGGADAAKFGVDAATGAVHFLSPPDFETPAAADGSNTYRLVVRASDGLHNVTQAVAVAVADVADASLPSNPTETQAEAVINGSAALVKGDVAVTGVLDFTRTDALTFAGVISGTGSVEKMGGGTLDITGVNTYSGQTKVDGGLLKVNGSIANSPVTVGSGAELGGSGTTGPVTLGAGAAIGAGNSPGTLNTGSLSLAAGAIYKQEVGGYAAGQFDVINVTGTVSLNGATLNATLFGGFTAAAGSSALVIINNDGTDAVVGTFAGLTEGATVNVGGRSATISYVGGTGNDVTLSFVAPATGGGGGGGGGVTTPPVPTPGQQASFAAQFANLLRATPTSADALNTSNPIYAQFQASTAIAAQYAAGTITQATAQAQLNHLVDGTVSVANLSYAFFTGKTPTSDGLDYLVHSANNATDLNDAYYLKFGTENRYINFAAALAKGGAGTAAYHAAYDGLSLTDAFAKAYATIFGVTPTAAKVGQILNDLVPDGQGGQFTRAQYFAVYGGDGANGVGTKAAAIGFLLADAIKEGIGPYSSAQSHFLADLGAGSALYNVDLVGTYATSGMTSAEGASLH